MPDTKTQATNAKDEAEDGFAEVESNHNTNSPAKPVPNGNLIGKPDYNPMRTQPNKANNASDVTLVPDTAADLIGSKGNRPSPTAPKAEPLPGTIEAQAKDGTGPVDPVDAIEKTVTETEGQ